jgi:hypothetical protein
LKPLKRGNIRIETKTEDPRKVRPASANVKDGQFDFDFGPLALEGGEPITVVVKDEWNRTLEVMPSGIPVRAPHPPSSTFDLVVKRPDVASAADPKMIDKWLAWETIQEPPESVAAACGPSEETLKSGVATFRITSRALEQSLTTWSVEMHYEGPEIGPPIAWKPSDDRVTRCRAWRSQQKSAWVRKLNDDTSLLDSVRGVTPAAELVTLYRETAETRGRLGAIALDVKDYDTARSLLEQSLKDFDQAGPDSIESRKQIQHLYERVQKEKVNGGQK